MIKKDLIDSCIDGDRSAHKELYDTTAPYVYTIIKNYISQTSFRKDAMQEVYAHIFSSLKSFDREKGSFKSWMARITCNRCAVLLRHNFNSSNDLEEESIINIPTTPFDFLDHLTKEDIEELLTEMPEGYRTIFLLSVIDGYNHKEIGELLNISQLTSRSQLSRGLKWIRSHFSLQSKDTIYGII